MLWKLPMISNFLFQMYITDVPALTNSFGTYLAQWVIGNVLNTSTSPDREGGKEGLQMEEC